MTLRAYWEPLNSKDVSYSKEETYTTALLESSSLILNPLVYQWSHEDDFINMMVTPLYTTEVDWDKAIKDGIANFVGDFSKIEARDYSAEELENHRIKTGATRFPVDADGNEHLTKDGKYDSENASKNTSLSWTYHIRKDLKFEDGTPITANTYEYTLKQYLDPKQNNYRSTIFYKDEVETNGAPIVNAAEYRKQLVNEEDVDWKDVGFEVIDDYTFKLTFHENVSQASAVTYGNNFRLVHPDKYEASLTNGINSTYGTPDTPFVSYGSYIMKSWDENQMIVFNKNYDYVARETISYKSQVIQIVDSISTQTQLYKDGTLSVLGLSNENYAEFVEEDNLKRGWNGYPQYIAINLGESRLEGDKKHEQPTIMFDERFRQALLYGFDRNYYNSSVYAPNVPSILPIPSDSKIYLQDALLFGESPNHLDVLDKHNIDPSTNGYIPERAKQLFDDAYADWLADGNTGPVVIKLVAANESELGISLAEFIESNYEKLFNGSDYNKDNPKKFDIQIEWGSQTTTTAAQKAWEFDIALLNVGFGASYGAHWQYPFISYLGANLGGADLGLSQPYDKSQEDGIAKYMKQVVEVDLTNTYEYLLALDQDGLEDWEKSLLAQLEEDGDKPAGIYKGPMSWIANYAADDNPWDEMDAEPFIGATEDLWNLLAMFEDVFFQHVPMIPTSTRASATVYKDYVHILWPEYTTLFGWGANRYRYLSSDPQLVDGLYNSYEAAYLAKK